MTKFIPIVLVFLFGSMAWAENACLHLFKYPYGAKLEGTRGDKVSAVSPQKSDYEARIENGDKFQLLTNLPEVSGRELIGVMEPGGAVIVMREQNGTWVNHHGQLIPSGTARRLEGIYQKSMQALSHINGIRFTSADLRFSRIPTRDTMLFHRDQGRDVNHAFAVVSSWDRPATYIQGKSGAIIQPRRSEAAILEMGPDGALHVYPAGLPIPTNFGVFVRMYFYTKY